MKVGNWFLGRIRGTNIDVSTHGSQENIAKAFLSDTRAKGNSRKTPFFHAETIIIEGSSHSK
jgi:hypothetical protein